VFFRESNRVGGAVREIRGQAGVGLPPIGVGTGRGAGIAEGLPVDRVTASAPTGITDADAVAVALEAGVGRADVNRWGREGAGIVPQAIAIVIDVINPGHRRYAVFPEAFLLNVRQQKEGDRAVAVAGRSFVAGEIAGRRWTELVDAIAIVQGQA